MFAVAVLAAAAFGTADFLGGLASRRAGSLTALLVAQLAGFPALLPALLVAGGAPPGRLDVLWAALAGSSGAVGLLLFFRALAGGLMSLAAPITSVVSAGVPVLAAVVFGERPDGRVWAGLAAGLIAVLIVGWPGAGVSGDGRRRAALLALGAGAGFGLFFVFISRTSPADGPWPLAIVRMASLTLVLTAVLAGRTPLGLTPGAARIAVASGVLDMTANVLFLVAERRAGLAPVAVLVSLYPAVTVVLALALLRERLRTAQGVGVGLALAAVVLIAGS